MKRRYPPFLTQDVLSAPEPETAIRILISRQSSTDRTIARRSGAPSKRGSVPRITSTSGAGFGALSVWLAVLVRLSVAVTVGGPAFGVTPIALLEPSSSDAAPRTVPSAVAREGASHTVGRPSLLSVSDTPAKAGMALGLPPSRPVERSTSAPATSPLRAVDVDRVPTGTASSPVVALVDSVEVDGEGIFLDQLVTITPATPLPHIRLAPAPGVGQATNLTRAQVATWIQTLASAVNVGAWSGAERTKITRRVRQLAETELREMLQTALQRDQVKDRGELELRLTRSWTTIAVADEPLTLKVVDLPTAGVGANFIVRFELWAGQERLGAWQLAAAAKVWKEILVAESPIKRGQLLRSAPITSERRDVLSLRETAITSSPGDTGAAEFEFKENVTAGQPILARSLRVRPVVFRGSIVDGLVQDGAMRIHLKVEVLEDGLPGHVIRVRNPRTRREMLGKVKNENTILITL